MISGIVIVDARVSTLYREHLDAVRQRLPWIEIEATEEAKSLERMPRYVAALSTHGLRRGQPVIAIGGGVVQDISCFIAAIYMRGVDWIFHPTTLVAQADSCIGSKSSINVAGIKNLVGTFTPPREVIINADVLATLGEEDLRSGIGEMLKVHAIKGPEFFDRLGSDYKRLLTDRDLLRQYIRDSLVYKQELIELDEFDLGPRLVMNYGHTFGHALEAATDYAVPHGIAVTIGMDMANFVAVALGAAAAGQYERMHPLLLQNYGPSLPYEVSPDRFLSAIKRDKKNVASNITLILPDAQSRIGRLQVANDEPFQSACREFLSTLQ